MTNPQLVGVDLRHGEFVISSYSKAKRPPVWVGNGHFARLPETTTDEELGTAIVEARAASEVGVDGPPPGEYSEHNGPFFAAFGVKDWSAYMKTAKSVSIRFDDGEVTVTPMRNKGKRNGFVPITSGRRVIPVDQPEAVELGAAVRAGFELAE